MPDIALKDGKPIIIDGKLATNCECCSCYYIRPAVCCDGDPGPVRYRVYGTHATLATFAASGDPFYAIIRPNGFTINEEYIVIFGNVVLFADAFECWLVEESTTCDEGEILDWVEFDGVVAPGDVYPLPNNIETATVSHDDTTFPAPSPCTEDDTNPDHCPVICDGECYSLSSTVQIDITCTLNLSDGTTQAISISKTGDMFHQTGSFRCDELIAVTAGNPGVSFNGCALITSYFDHVLPGPTRNVVITFAGSTPSLTDNLWDSGTGVTVDSVTDASVTYTFTSPNNWTLVDGVCVLEVAP